MAKAQEQIDDLKVTLDNLTDQVKQLHEAISQQGEKTKAAEKRIDEQLKEIRGDTKDLLGFKSGAEPMIKRLDGEVTEMRKEIRESSWGKWAKTAILTLAGIGITVLLACFGYLFTTHGAVSRIDANDKTRADQITALNTATTNLTNATTSLEASVKGLDRTVANLSAENQKLGKRLDDHGNKLDKLDKAIVDAVGQAKQAAIPPIAREQTLRLYLTKESLQEKGDQWANFAVMLPKPIPEKSAATARVSAKAALPLGATKTPIEIQLQAELSKDGRLCMLHLVFRGQITTIEELFKVAGTLPVDLVVTYRDP